MKIVILVICSTFKFFFVDHRYLRFPIIMESSAYEFERFGQSKWK